MDGITRWCRSLFVRVEAYMGNARDAYEDGLVDRGNMTKRPVLIINSEENDDWMKTLPGYKDEIEIIESLTKKKKAKLTFNKPKWRISNEIQD